MKASKVLRGWAAITALACAALHAQMPPQPQVSFTEGSSGTWNADWDGVASRTYFVQASTDLENWNFLPFLFFGPDLHGCGVETEEAPKFFIRLKYLDDPSITTQEEAEAADFDNDGLSNLVEVETTRTDPFNGDTDGDQMPDAWEHANGLDPTVNDAAADPDGDGLTNLEEFQNQTKPRYYDSDGDQLGDGFEVNTPGFNPLVYNDPNGDSDLDGLSDLAEMSNGTLASSSDSDSDGIPDPVELSSGTDPRDPNSKPFNHTSYFGGPIDPSMAPMGDLGVTFDTAGKFTLNLNLSDNLIWNPLNNRYQTEQEAWRVWMGNTRFVDTVPYPVPTDLGGGVISWRSPYQTPSANITVDGSKTYELRVQHLGVAGVAHPNYPDDPSPDYQHQLNFTSSGFLMTSNIPGDVVTRSIYRSTSQFGYNWADHRVYAVPIASLGYSTSYAGSDATGPRFRKISHFGRPIPDAKPEAETESDEAAEESYVDAFDLSLHHDTSFASIPLAASDLRLEANASVKETTWSSRSGLRPHEEITSPFGISWSSNLCSYIETVETLGSSTTRPTSVNVVDEGGRGQRFGTSDNMTTFFPWPSSLTDKKTYLSELTKAGNDLVLKKKFGNKLTYRPCDAWFMYSSDRLEYTPTVVRHRYWRLEEVEDRFGAKVQYDYGTNRFSLIPVEIRALNRPGQKLTIVRSTNGRRINSITDAENNTTNFEYTDKTISIPSTTLSYPYQELTWVEFPGGAKENYTYEVVSDPETVGTRVTQHMHANLKSIQRDGYAQRVFTYGFDRTKKWYDHSLGRIAIGANMDSLPPDVEVRFKDYVEAINKVPQFNSAIRVQYGVPRMVTNITWPALSIQSSFAKTPSTQTTYGPSFSSTSGTNVTDATGKKYTYTFGGTHGEIIDTDSSQTGGTSSVSTEWLVYHSNTTLEYKDASDTVLGSEYFEFDPDSGLSLKRTLDFCGKETIWNFDETRPVGPRLTLANNSNFLTKWADPTQKKDAQNRLENYEYGSHRMLTKLTDIHGAVTEYTVDSLGRRKDMTVKDSVGNTLQKEIYEYTDTNFPGFMTRKTRKAFSNLSGKSWEQNLVVEYEPDAYGRVWKEKVDPSGKNLVSTQTYDLNNQKKTTLDPRSINTSFEYDARNRLKKVTYASNSSISAFRTYGYDDNNAKIRETDENGHSTLIERDGLGRVVKSVRDLNGNGEIDLADDIVTQYTHDAVGHILAEIDPRGSATVTLRDDLHRPAHVFRGIPGASAGGALASLAALASSSREITHDEFTYDIAKNTGGGLLNPFKPTGTIRHNVVSMTRGQADTTLSDTAEYDDVYRPTQTSSEYKPGFYKTTHLAYGTVNGQGRESLESTVTDSLGKVTLTTRDALGREIEIIDGIGNTNPDLVLTITKHYTSTGLLWRTVDPLSRRTESEYDSVGRPVKVFQPDPSTGEITGNSPFTETEYDNDGNISAVIDPLNRRTDFAYDARNRKWQTQQPPVTNASNPDAPVANVRPTTTAYFDDAGNQIAVNDTRGSTTRMFYDKANRLVKTRTNPQSGNPSDNRDAPGTHDITVTTSYDKGGLALSVEDGNGNITRNAYDRLARLVATAINPASGNPATLAESDLDPAAYRGANSTSALVSYIHDDAGNIIEVTDGENHQTAFTFDGFNRKTGTIWDPGKSQQRTESFAFNALVQTSRLDGNGHLTNYGYDGLYRLEIVTYPGTSNPDNRLFGYDKAGKVLSVTYPSDPGSIRSVTLVYDKLDRLTSETSAGVTHTYPEYDVAGNRKQTTYGRTGTTLVCTYDSLNRLSTCEERSSATVPSGRTTIYAYDLGGKVTRKTLPNGNATTTTYDKIGRTLSMTELTSALAVVSSFDYSQSVGAWPFSHDGVGNVLRCAEHHTMAGMTDRVVANTYDHNNRLDTESITPSGGTAAITDYGYDLADNRVTKTVGSTVTVYQFGNGSNGANSNQLKSYGQQGIPVTYSFTYDNNGNRTGRLSLLGTDFYSWDDENRLISFKAAEGGTSRPAPGGGESLQSAPDGGIYTYTYDHRGRRVVRDESAAGGVLTELTFSGGTSVQEADDTGTVQTELIRGSDWGGGVGGVLFTIRSGQRSYNAYNSRGDVVSTSGDTGTATWQAAYEAFGTRTAEDGTNTERQRANTKDEDPTGLLNEGHRYRDLDAGVFISRDPAGFVDGPNVYAYVRQNPWSAFDPEGLDMLSDINSMGNDWFGFWGGVGSSAANLATGVAKTAWNSNPAVNLAQLATGNKTGYQKQFDGANKAYSGYVAAAENLGANAQTSGRTMTESLLDAAANHVDAATKDPRKFGELSFNAVTTLATGADATLGLLSKSSNAAAATARGTQAVAETEVVVAETAAKSAEVARMPALPTGEAPYQLKLFPDEAYSRTGHYGNTPTSAQRASVPAGMEFDHNPTLVEHYYEGNGGLPGFNQTQTERLQHARSLDSGGAATPAQQRVQGGAAAQYSKEQKKKWGL